MRRLCVDGRNIGGVALVKCFFVVYSETLTFARTLKVIDDNDVVDGSFEAGVGDTEDGLVYLLTIALPF